MPSALKRSTKPAPAICNGSCMGVSCKAYVTTTMGVLLTLMALMPNGA